MNYNVPKKYCIDVNSKRNSKKTLNGLDLSDALIGLVDSLKDGAPYDANVQIAELFASGFNQQFWKTIIMFYFKYINFSNPLFVNYLYQKIAIYDHIKKSGKNLYNNQELRNHLSEMVSVLCLLDKIEINIPKNVKHVTKVDAHANKYVKIIKSIAPEISPQSPIYSYFSSFIEYFDGNKLDICTYYLDWFVKENDYTVNVSDLNFKLPPNMKSKSIWIIWKFLISKCKNTISKEFEETLVSFYLMIYKSHDYETCTYLVFFIMMVAKCPQFVQWKNHIQISHPEVIKNCMNINIIYSLIKSDISCSTDPPLKNTNKSKSDTNSNFYKNKSQYLKLLNNKDLLIHNNQSKITTNNGNNHNDQDLKSDIISVESNNTSPYTNEVDHKDHKDQIGDMLIIDFKNP
jgi:hypothetical protein